MSTLPDPSTDEVREPCPTPLSWQQVLETYRGEADPWQAELGTWHVTGRVWGSGPALYLLNDLSCDAESYALLGYLLREHYRCVFIDHPGIPAELHGKLQAEHLAAFIVAAADELGDDQLHLYAAGFGSVAALTLMRDVPERLGRVVLQSGYARRKLSLTERLLLAWGRRSQAALSAVPGRIRILENNHRQWFPPYDHSRWDHFVARQGERPVRQLAELASVLRTYDLSSAIPELTTPTLLARTEGEGIQAARDADWLRDHLPDCQEEWLHTTGQLSSLTHPHRMAKLIREFLEAGTPDDSGTA